MRLSRRHILQLTATSAAIAALPLSLHAVPKAQLARWQGMALGAEASITLAHSSKGRADKMLKRCTERLSYLESQFSLYQPDSALSRLNRDGILANPAPEMLQLLRLSKHYHQLTHGYFDPTVQPLWQQAMSASGRATIGMDKVALTANSIRLEPGMQLTLNGIAQGYITDQMHQLLRAAGYENILLNMGEYRAAGSHPDGRDWQLALADPQQPWRSNKQISLESGRALAVSSHYGTRFKNGSHHLFNPHQQQSADAATCPDTIALTAPSAAQADALSTALCVMPHAAGQQLLQTLPSIHLIS